MSGESLDLFQGKWKELDGSVAIQARDALQKMVDSWKAEGEKKCYTRTTVLLTVFEEDGTKSSRLSRNHGSADDIREALEVAVTAEVAPTEDGTRLVAETWATRLAAEYAPALKGEIELLTVAVLKPLLEMDYKNLPMPLIETLALQQGSEVSAKDIEDGYSYIRSVLDPMISDIMTQLQETREKIERALRDNPQMGFHADL